MAGVVRLDQAAVARLLRGKDGPVMRQVALRATKVQVRAKQLVGKDTRRLEHSIVKRFVNGPNGPSVWVGSDEPHARFHHEGTRPHEIVPRNASVLAFEVGGVTVFAKRVQHPGTRPNRFLVDAARAEGLRVRLRGGSLGTGVIQ